MSLFKLAALPFGAPEAAKRTSVLADIIKKRISSVVPESSKRSISVMIDPIKKLSGQIK